MLKQVFLLMDLVCLAALSAGSAGCSRSSSETTRATEVPTKQELASDKPRKDPRVPLRDGFEADSIATFWLPANYGTGLYVPGAIVISKDYARSGTHSARITVKEGDIEQRGDDGKRVERAELDSGHHPVLGRDVWYGFSFLLPPGFPIVDNRL